MNNYLVMYADFNKEKNRKAWFITLGVAGALLLFFILWKWPLPTIPQPIAEEYIEVDLGNSEFGSNLEEDMLPGDPAQAQQTAYNAPQPTPAANDDAKDADEDEAPDAAVVKKPLVVNPNATKINADNKTVKTNTTPAPAVVAPPVKKAVMGKTMGSNGNGGNGADTYKPGGGDGTGGTGNRGSVGGDPNGRGTGTPRNLGIRTVNIPSQSFEDDFNESGKVVLDIVVNSDGKLISASYQPSGSSITNRNQIEIAKRRAAQIAYPKYEGGFKQRLSINFQVKG
jgi:outer membrane biosynthesis protein TonB